MAFYYMQQASFALTRDHLLHLRMNDRCSRLVSWKPPDNLRPFMVTTEVLPIAKAKGAIGLFTDKYGGDVSVYTIGDKSMECCGGPHFGNTEEIGRFKIQKEQSSSAGVTRARAVIQ